MMYICFVAVCYNILQDTVFEMSKMLFLKG